MARGDVISQIEDVTGGYMYLIPSSGDEWMITAVGSSQDDVYAQATIDSGNNWTTMYSTDRHKNTPSISANLAEAGWMSHSLQWFISQSKRIRFVNSANDAEIWFMGVKSKD